MHMRAFTILTHRDTTPHQIVMTRYEERTFYPLLLQVALVHPSAASIHCLVLQQQITPPLYFTSRFCEQPERQKQTKQNNLTCGLVGLLARALG